MCTYPDVLLYILLFPCFRVARILKRFVTRHERNDAPVSAVLCLPACLCVSTAASRGQAPPGNASLQIVESTVGEGRGVKTKVDIEADTCLGEYKGERIEGTAPDCLTGMGDKVLCIKGGGADSKTGRGVWVDGGKRGNILSRINARPRLEDCDVIIHLDDGTPRVYTRREVKAGTELAMFYGADYPLPPSLPPADAADPDEPAADGSNQPVLTTQNILPSASALPAGQLYADDGSLVGRQ